MSVVALFPDRDDVEVDVRRVRPAAAHALADRGQALATPRRLQWYAGPLLRDYPYEPWTDEPRGRPVDSTSTCSACWAGGTTCWPRSPPTRRRTSPWPGTAPRPATYAGRCVQLERLEQALHRELGASPSAEAVRLRTELERSPRPACSDRRANQHADGVPAVRLFGRRDVGDRVRAILDDAGAGRGVTVLLTGPAGVGKSAVLDLAAALARRRGWRTGRGGAASVEGPWPYSPVLEALSALCRRHPALLDGLGDDYRTEIERALTGRDLGWTGENSHQRLFVAVAELMRVAAAGTGLLLMVDDVQDADEASLRLLHYLSRCSVDERVVLVLAHRDPAPAPVAGRHHQHRVARGQSPARAATAHHGRLPAAARRPLPRAGSAAVEEVAQAGAGLPFPMIETARARVNGSGPYAALLPPAALRTFQRIALMGLTFTTDELLAIADGPEDEAYREAGAGAGCPGGGAGGGRFPLPAPSREGGPAGHAAAVRAPTRTPASGGGARRVGAPTGPGRPPLPRRRPGYAGGAVRRRGRGDRRSAGCLPRCADPGRRRARAGRSGPPAGAAVASG